MDFGFLVISSVFYVVLYGPRCWVNKRSLLSEFRHSAFVYLSVCCFERLLEGPLLSFLLFVVLLFVFICCLSFAPPYVTSFVRALLGRGLEGFLLNFWLSLPITVIYTLQP